MDSIKNKLRGFLKLMAKKKFNVKQWKMDNNFNFDKIENVEQLNFLFPLISTNDENVNNAISDILNKSDQEILDKIFLEFINSNRTRDYINLISKTKGVDETYRYINMFLNVKINEATEPIVNEFESVINKANAEFNEERLKLSNQISAINNELNTQKENNNKLVAEINSLVELVKDYKELKQNYDKLTGLHKDAIEKLKQFDQFKVMMKRLIN